MILYPAIDLMDGKVVRLRQGLAQEKTVYSDDPAGMAARWEKEGGHWIHLVDLDAAFHGEQKNLDSVRAITRAVSIPCELGGGIRSAEAIERALNAGVARVVIGTRAAEAMGFVEDMVRRFGSDRIAVGIDAKDGKAAVRGWTETTNVSAIDLAKQAEKAGAGTIIYTDIATDGMLTGPNYAGLQAMLDAVNCNVIASGGVSSIEDLGRLASMPRIHGAIIGKALYDGKLDLKAAADLPGVGGHKASKVSNT